MGELGVMGWVTNFINLNIPCSAACLPVNPFCVRLDFSATGAVLKHLILGCLVSANNSRCPLRKSDILHVTL